MRAILLALCVLLLMSGASSAAPTTKPAAPANDPAAGEDVVISKMRVQEFKPQTYLYTETETTLTQIGTVAHNLVEKLEEAVKEGNVQITGPLVFVYHGVTQDPNNPFKLQIGFSVDPKTKEVADFKVRELAKFRAATVIFSGAVAQVGQAYQQVFGDLFAANLEPTGETREYYLYWESPESPNNVELIQVGIK